MPIFVSPAFNIEAFKGIFFLPQPLPFVGAWLNEKLSNGLPYANNFPKGG